MNKSVSHYISELLFLHDCVVLPEFGGFVGNKQSAKLNTITSELLPPSKQLLFNKNLTTNDGLLINHIANQEGITNKKAKKEVEKFINNINKTLTDKRVLRIKDIGIFSLGEENNILFLQDKKINYNLASFGMEKIVRKNISRITIEKKVDETIEIIKKTKKQPKFMLRAAAIILPLFTLSYLSISQQDNISLVYAKMGQLNLNPTHSIIEKVDEAEESSKTKKIIIEANENNIVEKLNETVIEPSLTIENEEEYQTLNVLENKRFYIIAGAFSEERNAYKLINQLRKKDYDPEIIDGGTLLRVSYNSFENKELAISVLNEIRKENRSAWLLTK